MHILPIIHRAIIKLMFTEFSLCGRHSAHVFGFLETEAGVFLGKCSAADLQSQSQAQASQMIFTALDLVAIYYAHLPG